MQSFINVETPGPIVTRPTLNGDVEYDRAAYSSSEMVDVHRGSWLSKDRKQSEPVAVRTLRCIGGRDRNFAMGKDALDDHLELMKERAPRLLHVEHPSIVPFLDYDVRDEEPVFVTPWLPHNLRTAIQNGETDFIPILMEVAVALDHLHTLNPPMAHGGLSLGAVLINEEGRPMLSNFGLEPILNYVVADMQMTMSNGITSYMPAPEVLETSMEAPIDEIYTPASDAYDFGSLIVHVCSGTMPWKPQYTRWKALQRILAGKRPERKDHPGLPQDHKLWELVDWCWQHDPADRPTAQQIYNFLSQLRFPTDANDSNVTLVGEDTPAAKVTSAKL